ncbi:multicopper oxidase family protein [Nocardia arthritidis]|uniref:Multicopper oxidase domain-containing protein n=1 Tax=Nocardia arthritidis TaxID=228602 RepID=A0A6G9YR28_9NOCA|nr:multicopper oxidase family protein [Nocardia arthritidis]QIS15674.1 multicopper oxidase domain-containing protein [Nocardia arthritidis]
MRRRGFLLAGGAAVLGATMGASVPWLISAGETGRLLRSEMPLPQPFRVPLPIPPVLVPRADETTDYYEITQRVAMREIVPGVSTEIWGYDGIFPGPTIVSRSGRRTVVRYRNELPVPTVVHLHGGHTPADSDGYPTDLIMPQGITGMHGHSMGHSDSRAVIADGMREYVYPMRQRAATHWYHDHRMDFTGPGVWRGLAGFHLIRDDEEAALPLPAGDRDIPLLLTDRAFGSDGELLYPAVDPGMPGVRKEYRQGVLGDVILVNGAPWPMLEVAAVRYRFRVLNASNARRYRLALEPDSGGFSQIGSDGGLLAAPVRHDEIDIAPAERFDLVIDFSRYSVGEQVVLVNRLDSGPAGRVMAFRVVRAGRDDSRVPDRLSVIEPPRTDDAVTTRTFSFRDNGGMGWNVNGAPFEPDRITARPRLGDTEIWRFSTDFHHPIHLHLNQFQVLSRNGAAPGPYDAGWKDTINLRPAEIASVLVRFTDYRGRFLYHCHNLEHEDMAMMANFEVV